MKAVESARTMENVRVAILGFAGQGRSALDYWSAKKAAITICDRDIRLKLPKGIKHRLGKDYLKNLDKFDLLVRTPALHPNDIVKANPNHPNILKKVTTVTNEFFKACPTGNIIGVTGTKGKGTTSTLIAKMLEASGLHTHLGGNIGIPPLDLLKNGIESTDWVVLELANFQLIDLKASPRIGVCLMVTEEHLDWHTDLTEYITAKQQMFAYQNSRDIVIYHADNETSKAVTSISKARRIPYCAAPGAYVDNGNIVIDNRAVCAVNDIKLLGKHNLQNVCAAITAVWQVTQDPAAIQWTLQTFAGLEHRLERVREVDGVEYYDDSFGTTPETAVVAIEAFSKPKIIILGGSDKGSSFEKLAMTVKNHNVREVILMGNTTNPFHKTASPDIDRALKDVGFRNITSIIKPGGVSMEEVVRAAQSKAQKGDIVILSTGCASFDMFDNYKHRGEAFKNAVWALQATPRNR